MALGWLHSLTLVNTWPILYLHILTALATNGAVNQSQIDTLLIVFLKVSQ